MWKSGIRHRHTGAKYWAVVLNVAGDWPWLVKAGNLGRSFSHAIKNLKTLKKPPAGICHKCRAGQLEHAFETFETRNPSWLSTLHCQSPFLDPPSPLASFLCTRGQEADIFAYDLWHSWHLGVGKVFLGSALALLSSRFHGRNVHARFAGLNSAYFAWCREFSHPPILTRLQQASTIEWEISTTYPHAFLVDLVLAADRGPWVVNPICYSVQQSEDYIGRNSRTSRKVHPTQAARRTIERHLVLAYRKYCDAGLLVEGRD